MSKKSLSVGISVAILTSGIMVHAAVTNASSTSENTPSSHPIVFPHLSNLVIGQYLGWIHDPELNRCEGYYLDEPIIYTGTGQVGQGYEEAPLQLSAKYSDYHLHGRSTFKGDVTITQPQRQVVADNATVFTDENGKLSQIDLTGNVTFREPGRLLVADEAYLPLDQPNNQYTLIDVIYRISRASFDEQDKALPSDTAHKETGLSAWGVAKKAQKTKPQVLVLKHATYTTCPPNTSVCDWKISATKVTLNKNTGRGSAINPILYAKGIPVFYSPYLNFPIDDRRQSGFLFPTFSHNEDSGYGITTPFYLNLAPNYDATLYPTYFSERGWQFGTELRYLTPYSNGIMSGSILPNDREFDNFKEEMTQKYGDETNKRTAAELENLQDDDNTRKAFHWKDNTLFNSYWTGHVDFNYVSDDYYLEDFSGTFTQPVDNQLLRQADLNYFGEHWTLLGMLQGYQTLHPVDQDNINNQYSRLPEIALTGDYPDQWGGLDFGTNASFDYFYNSANPGITTEPVIGKRENVRPSVSLPITRPYGYITPGVQMDATAYQLVDQGTDSVTGELNPDYPTRTVPIYYLDSGLYFNRDMQWLQQNYTQTLEPRLYYLYVPYRNQDDLPDFDSQLYTLSYDQLFQTNRFSSVDRIGDANQLAFGATTRFIDQESGQEKFSLSVGDIWYFQDRRVELCSTDDCIARDEQRISPITGQFNYHINPTWSLTGSTLYNAGQHLFENASAGIGYHLGTNKFVKLSYHYVYEGNIYVDEDTNNDDSDNDLTNLSAIRFSFAWPLNDQWSTLGGVQYDTTYSNGVSYIAGLEYNSCCWAIRVVAERSLIGVEDSENQYDQTYYVQFVLKGLSTIGVGDPGSAIASFAPGYKDNFNEVP